MISKDFRQLRDRTRLVETVSGLAVGLLSEIGSTGSLQRDARSGSESSDQVGVDSPSRICPARGIGQVVISYRGDQPTAIPMLTSSGLNAVPAATMMSTWSHTDLIQVLDLSTNRSICRVLDSVLLCMGLLQVRDIEADRRLAYANVQLTNTSYSDAESDNRTAD